jgi:hypothetical protein
MDLGGLAPDEDEAEEVMDLGGLAPDEDDAEDVMDLGGLAPDDASAVGDILSEEAADAPMEEMAEPPIYTRTIAELYVAQGAASRAADVYRHLLEADPDDEALSARLAELESQVRAEAMQDGEATSDTSGSTDEGDEHVESLARDLAETGDGTHDVDTPFAWTEEAPPVEVDPDAPPVSDYFSRMLGWTPGADESDAGGDES